MFRRPHLGLSILTIVTASLAACSSDDESSSAAALAASCSINSDCSEPLVCAYRKCHDQCTSSRDCPSGQRCMAGDRPFHVCQLPEEQKCTFNSDCAIGQLCASDGQCRDQCAGDRDCVVGQLCVAGTCAEPRELVGGKLPNAADAGTVGQSCTYSSECDEGLVCRAGRCKVECEEDRDCTSGLLCRDNRCAGRTCGESDAGLALSAGASCSYTSECSEGLVCRAHTCDCECLAPQDCAVGQTCQGYRCVPTGGGGGDGGLVETDGGSDGGAVETDGGSDGGDVAAPNWFVIARNQGEVTGIVVAGSTVVWTTRGGTVAACPVFKRCDTPSLLTSLTGPGDIATDRYTVYVTERGTGAADGAVYALNPNYPDDVSPVVDSLPGPGPIAVGDAGMLYVAVRGTAPGYDDGGIIAKFMYDESSPTPLVTGDLDIGSLAVHGSTIYFTSGGLVKTIPTTGVDGGAPETFATPGSASVAVAVDDANVYFTTKSGDVFSCPHGDVCPSPTLLGNGAPEARQIASDGVRVFWIALGDDTNGHHDGVFACNVTGCDGAPTELATDPIDGPIALDPAHVVFSGDGEVRRLDKTTGCGEGLADCDGDPNTGVNGCETEIATALDHCGTCMHSCVIDDQTDVACRSGACSIVECPYSWDDCNHDPEDGCETNTGYDTSNCGGCGVVCGDQNTTEVECEGACYLACEPGFADCNGDPSDGCEASLDDPQHCGACERDCVGGACVRQTCQINELTVLPGSIGDLVADESAAYVSLPGSGEADGEVLAVAWDGTQTELAKDLVSPEALAVANDELYVLLTGETTRIDATESSFATRSTTANASAALLQLNRTTGKQEKVIALGEYVGAHALAVNGKWAYVGAAQSSRLLQVNLETDAVVELNDQQYYGGAVAAYGQYVYFQRDGALMEQPIGSPGGNGTNIGAAYGSKLITRDSGTGGLIFFQGGNGIMRMSIPSGGLGTIAAQLTGGWAMAMAVDPDPPFNVYWANEDGEIMQGDRTLAVGQSNTTLMAATSQRVLWVRETSLVVSAKAPPVAD